MELPYELPHNLTANDIWHYNNAKKKKFKQIKQPTSIKFSKVAPIREKVRQR